MKNFTKFSTSIQLKALTFEQTIKEHNEKVTSKPRDQTPKRKLRKKSRMSNGRELSS